MHYGLLPRANRGIFAINELPDLAGKIQVGLFNIMQEGDVQIKGYPIRLPLDVLLVFTANPEDYTARGKIITPLKDRVGSEIRTHYPATVEEGMAITAQEAWMQRSSGHKLQVPDYIREVVEQTAFLAREDKRVDRRSGVSQRLPIAYDGVRRQQCRAARRPKRRKPCLGPCGRYLRSDSSHYRKNGAGIRRRAERRGKHRPGTRSRSAIGKVYTKYIADANMQPVVQWFENGGDLKIPENATAAEQLAALRRVEGLLDHIDRLGANAKDPVDPRRAVVAQAHRAREEAELADREVRARSTGRQGDPAGARDQFAALLPVRERVSGAEDPETLTVRAGVALWTGRAGDPAGSRSSKLRNTTPIRTSHSRAKR